MSDTSVPSSGAAGLADIVAWYDVSARDLPWRSHPSDEQPSPWAVLVSEVMLQQTPVSRVLPVYQEWMHRWPNPSALAAEAAGEAVRVWGRLGYPRRALRLHAAAQDCVDRFGGLVPASVGELRSLPGVGEYTASAVAAFAFGGRYAVLDTNVRRVHARWLDGTERPVSTAVTNPERARALELLPAQPDEAVRASVAVMELGALVCTARSPKCTECPVNDRCSWRLAGHPASETPARGQSWAGTDRQCRGRLMAVVRDAPHAVTHDELTAVWEDDIQRERALAGLITDGLIVPDGTDYRLP